MCPFIYVLFVTREIREGFDQRLINEAAEGHGEISSAALTVKHMT